MARDKLVGRVVADIIAPDAAQFAQRYSNIFHFKKGSRFVNMTACPLCARHLRGQSCGDCPMDLEFGIGHVLYGEAGCKVAIKRLWGPFTFGDFPSAIVRAEPFNGQLERINRFVRTVMGE